jgi:hypothetical protein
MGHIYDRCIRQKWPFFNLRQALIRSIPAAEDAAEERIMPGEDPNG